MPSCRDGYPRGTHDHPRNGPASGRDGGVPDPHRRGRRRPLRPASSDRDRGQAAFAALAGQADLVLLAGDLTTHGEPEQAAILAEAAARGAGVPVFTVLGNHDWHANRARRGRRRPRGRRDRRARPLAPRRSRSCGAQVGIVGAKGFVGGFPGSHLPDFGEPLLREVYARRWREVAALDAALRAIALCPFRIVLLHYAPTTETLEGERRDIWAFLGTDRLAAPIAEHAPDLVLHGHAHAGTFAGRDRRGAGLQRLRAGDGRGLLGVRAQRRAARAVRSALTRRVDRKAERVRVYAPVQRTRGARMLRAGLGIGALMAMLLVLAGRRPRTRSATRSSPTAASARSRRCARSRTRSSRSARRTRRS